MAREQGRSKASLSLIARPKGDIEHTAVKIRKLMMIYTGFDSKSSLLRLEYIKRTPRGKEHQSHYQGKHSQD